jgi:hypothetical protein
MADTVNSFSKQKQELPVAAMFAYGSQLDEQSL